MCTACQNAQINGRKRKKNMAKKRKTTRRRSRISGFNSKGAVATLTAGVLPGAVGAVLLQKVLSSILPAEYQQYSNYVLLAGGVLAASGMLGKNAMVQSAGLGAATVAGYNVVSDLADGQAVTGLGLLPPGVPAVRIAGMPASADGVTTL